VLPTRLAERAWGYDEGATGIAEKREEGEERKKRELCETVMLAARSMAAKEDDDRL